MILVKNPSSRNGRGQRLWQDWERGLAVAGCPLRTLETNGVTDVERISEIAAHETLVAVGGDGTINTVINGAMHGRADAVGVLYAGTSPDFCRFHQIPCEPVAALAVLQANKQRKIDLLRATYATVDGSATSAWAGCSCNVGLGAETARVSNRVRRYVGDFAGTLIGVISALMKHRSLAIDVNVDGVTHAYDKVDHLVVCKNPWIASGIQLGLGILPDDGRMAVVIFHQRGLLSMLKLLHSLYRGTMTQCSKVDVLWGHRVEVTSTHRCEVEFDGDPQGWLPLRVELVPKALSLITERDFCEDYDE